MVSSVAMVPARVFLPVVLAGILGLMSGAADAQRRNQRPPPQSLSPDEAFVQARQLAYQNDLDRFDAVARAAAEHPLRAYLDYWRLRIQLNALNGTRIANGTANPSDVDAAVLDVLQKHPGTAMAEQLRHDWLLSLGRRGEWARFDEQYPLWAWRDNPQIHCRAGQSRLAAGQPVPAQSRDALMQPRELGDGCAAFLDALLGAGGVRRADLWRRLELALEGNGVATVRRIGGMLGLEAGAVEAALQRPARLLGAESDRMLLVIALVQLARQDPQLALEQGAADLRELPAPERAFVWTQVAAQAMRRLHPRALEWTREALAAMRQIPAAARDVPVLPVASDETLVWMARAALRGHDWRTLHAVIDRMSPDGRREPAWVYWSARAHREFGRPAEAQAQMRTIAGQFHFYGQLATEELGGPAPLPPRAAAPTDAELAEAERNPAFARALAFYALGLRVEGNREWNLELRSMNDRQLLAAAAWACRRSVLDRCVNTADRTQAEHDFTLRFVTPFREQLAPIAAERELDMAWVYGLIRQESRFIMNARSSASAQGLMQIIPPTARWIANRLGVRDFRIEHLHDLDTNLRFGTYYLKNVLDDLDGSPLLASAGYNAGPNRPRTWRSTLPFTVEGAVFAEIIPFTETRDYVKKVLSNATFYGTLLTGEPRSLKTLLGSVAPMPAKSSTLP